jgi:hypothetical protein
MENIIISFVADTSGLDQVQNELARLDDMEERLKNEFAAYAKEYNKTVIALAKSGKTQTEIANEQAKALDKMKEGQSQITDAMKETRKSIVDLHAQMKNADATVAAGAATSRLTTEMRTLRDEISKLELSGDTSSQRFIDLSVRAAELQDQIGDTQQQIRALASDTRNLDAAMSVGQGLTGAFAAATAGAALLGGENEELQEAFFKVEAALQVLNGVQAVADTLNKDSVASVIIRNAMSKLFTRSTIQEAVAINATTAATGANTAATGAATVATRAWTMALLANPVFWIVAIIMGAVVAIGALVKSMNAQAKAAIELAEIENRRIEAMNEREAREQKYYDDNVKGIEREIDILVAQGASEEEIFKKRKERQRLADQFAGKRMEDHKKEVYELEENEEKLKKYKETLEGFESGYNKAKRRRWLFEDVYYVDGKPFNDIDDAMKYVQEKIKSTDSDVQKGIDTSNLVSDNNLSQVKLNEDEKKSALKNAATIAQVRLDAAEKGSQKELQLRIDVLEKERQISLSASGLSAADRIKINADADREIQNARREYEKQQLVDQKVGIEARLAQSKDGSIDEFNLRKELLFAQYSIDIQNADLSKNEKEKIYNEYIRALEKMDADYNKQASADALDAQIATLNARLSGVEKGGELELNLRKQIAEKQAEMERKSIESSVQNEELKAAKILEVDAKLKAELEQSQKDYDQKVIDNILKSTQTEIDAERIKNEKLATSGNFIQRMRAQMDLKKNALEAIDAEALALEASYEKGIVSEQEYLQRKAELQNQYGQLELQTLKDIESAKSEIRQAAFDLGASLANSMFDSQKAALQQQLEDLQHYYTTDEKEAEENADKQLITKEELARRELEIKQKLAKTEKQQAIFDAGIQLAQGIVRIWSQAGIATPLAIAMTALLTATAGTQIAAIASKPLPKYAKGKKGTKSDGGEWAWVGERGPEIMFVPHMASIIPAHKSRNVTPDVMRDFNITMPDYPRMPKIDFPISDRSAPYHIDYNKLGKAVANNVKIPAIPEVQQLNVSMDESGFSKYLVTRNSNSKVLNTKYSMN